MNPFQLSTTLVFHIFISLLPNEKQRAAVFLGDSPETQFAISAYQPISLIREIQCTLECYV
jgi:hypothetical protein